MVAWTATRSSPGTKSGQLGKANLLKRLALAAAALLLMAGDVEAFGRRGHRNGSQGCAAPVCGTTCGTTAAPFCGTCPTAGAGVASVTGAAFSRCDGVVVQQGVTYSRPVYSLTPSCRTGNCVGGTCFIR